MKTYTVTKTYRIHAQDDIHLHAILRAGEMNAMERYRTEQEIKRIPKRTAKKRWNPWLAQFGSQMKYLVIGK
jgi:hypothetical protein